MLTKYQELWLENETNKLIVERLRNSTNALEGKFNEYSKELKDLEKLRELVFFKSELKSKIKEVESRKWEFYRKWDDMKTILNEALFNAMPEILYNRAKQVSCSCELTENDQKKN
jgi:hypothetical protein